MFLHWTRGLCVEYVVVVAEEAAVVLGEIRSEC